MAFINLCPAYPCGSGMYWSWTVCSKELTWYSSAVKCFDTCTLLELSWKWEYSRMMVKSAQCSKSNPLHPPISGIQDTCRQGRAQVVFQRDFLAQSGNVEHMTTRHGAGLVNTSLRSVALPLKNTQNVPSSYCLHAPCSRRDHVLWVWRVAFRYLMVKSKKLSCRKEAQVTHWLSVGFWL